MREDEIEIRPELVDPIREAAQEVGQQLGRTLRPIELSLQPGDSTVYQILLTPGVNNLKLAGPPTFSYNAEFIVTLMYMSSKSLAWNSSGGGQAVPEMEIQSHHTRAVMREFLDQLTKAL